MVHFINVLNLLYTDIASIFSVDTTNIGMCFLVFSNFIFILPLCFFIYRSHILFKIFHNHENFENRISRPSLNMKIIQISRIYLMQFLLTLITMISSMGFHSNEKSNELKHMDKNSVALLLSVNFVYLISDELHIKNYLECFLLLYKTLVASLDMSPDVINGLQISLFLFIIILNTRQHILHIGLPLIIMIFISITTFSIGEYVYSITHNSNTDITPLIEYDILHTSWHICIGLTYFFTLLQLKKIQSTNNNQLLLIESIYCHNFFKSKSINESFLDYDEMYST